MESHADIEAIFGKREIRFLVYFNKNVLVYVDNEFDVNWVTTPEYDELFPKNNELQNEVLNLAASIETTPCEYLNESLKLGFKRLVGEGIARALREDYVNAKQILAKAEAFVNQRSQEQSRFWYLSASGCAGAVAGAVGLILWLNRTPAIKSIGTIAFEAILACVAGALGATLSIIMRMGKVHLDSLSGRSLHYMEGASRVIAGSLSGLLVFLAFMSGQILPALMKSGNAHVAILLIALVAGASERWAPSIVSRLESSAGSAGTQKTTEPAKAPK